MSKLKKIIFLSLIFINLINIKKLFSTGYNHKEEENILKENKYLFKNLFLNNSDQEFIDGKRRSIPLYSDFIASFVAAICSDKSYDTYFKSILSSDDIYIIKDLSFNEKIFRHIKHTINQESTQLGLFYLMLMLCKKSSERDKFENFEGLVTYVKENRDNEKLIKLVSYMSGLKKFEPYFLSILSVNKDFENGNFSSTGIGDAKNFNSGLSAYFHILKNFIDEINSDTDLGFYMKEKIEVIKSFIYKKNYGALASNIKILLEDKEMLLDDEHKKKKNSINQFTEKKIINNLKEIYKKNYELQGIALEIAEFNAILMLSLLHSNTRNSVIPKFHDNRTLKVKNFGFIYNVPCKDVNQTNCFTNTLVYNDIIVDKTSGFPIIRGGNGSGKSAIASFLMLTIKCAQAWNWANAEVYEAPYFDYLKVISGTKSVIGEGVGAYGAQLNEFEKLIKTIQGERNKLSFIVMDEAFNNTNPSDAIDVFSNIINAVINGNENVFGVIVTHYRDLSEIANSIRYKFSVYDMQRKYENGKVQFFYKIEQASRGSQYLTEYARSMAEQQLFNRFDLNYHNDIIKKIVNNDLIDRFLQRDELPKEEQLTEEQKIKFIKLITRRNKDKTFDGIKLTDEEIEKLIEYIQNNNIDLTPDEKAKFDKFLIAIYVNLN